MAEPSRRTRLIVAGAAVAIGVFSAFMVRAHPESLHAPNWVAYVAASAFVMAGLCLFAGSFGLAWLECWLAIAVTVALFAVSLWIAVGAGEHACSLSVPGFAGDASDAVCRGAFGIGALLVGVLLGLLVYRLITRRSGP
jgi:hypothetical protein